MALEIERKFLKSLEKVLRKGTFTYTVDKAFSEVILAYASVPRPGQDGTWITEFAHAPDASKCAFATFARRMFAAGTPWIDCQVYTDHLARFGAKEIPRSAYLDLLAGEMARMA